MRKEIRDDILNAAKALFVTKGYRGVSLQDIADVVGISKGNLTYHFNKKEMIIEALLSRNGERKHHAVPTTLQELDHVFLDMQQAIQNNAYYFLRNSLNCLPKLPNCKPQHTAKAWDYFGMHLSIFAPQVFFGKNCFRENMTAPSIRCI